MAWSAACSKNAPKRHADKIPFCVCILDQAFGDSGNSQVTITSSVCPEGAPFQLRLAAIGIYVTPSFTNTILHTSVHALVATIDFIRVTAVMRNAGRLGVESSVIASWAKRAEDAAEETR